jgi:predicted PurR-regulated permease PerM
MKMPDDSWSGRYMKKTRADRENSELLKIVGGIVVIVTLYFARVVFIPLALAWLFSLLLIPPVSFLERIKLPRILAIFLIVVV